MLGRKKDSDGCAHSSADSLCSNPPKQRQKGVSDDALMESTSQSKENEMAGKE